MVVEDRIRIDLIADEMKAVAATETGNVFDYFFRLYLG
jgi:hypothetical protein